MQFLLLLVYFDYCVNWNVEISFSIKRSFFDVDEKNNPTVTNYGNALPHSKFKVRPWPNQVYFRSGSLTIIHSIYPASVETSELVCYASSQFPYPVSAGGTNIYVRYMSKCIKNIFAKSCMINPRSTYLFFRSRRTLWVNVTLYIFRWSTVSLLLIRSTWKNSQIFFKHYRIKSFKCVVGIIYMSKKIHQ